MYRNPMRIVSIVDQIQNYKKSIKLNFEAQYSTFTRRNKATIYLRQLIA